MGMRIRYSLEVNQKMIDFLKANLEARFEQAKEYAKTLGIDQLSKNKFADLRRQARGPGEAVKEIYLNMETGSRYKNLDSAKGGDRIAIYELKRRARIQVTIVDEA
jgi:hypothetical protein